MHKVREIPTFLRVALPDIHRFYFFFTGRLNSKPFLIYAEYLECHVRDVRILESSFKFGRVESQTKDTINHAIMRNLPNRNHDLS